MTFLKNFITVIFFFSIILSPAAGCSVDVPGAGPECRWGGPEFERYMYLNLDEISETADIIVLGTVGQSTTFRDYAVEGGYSDANADTIVYVDEYLKGEDSSQIHVITQGSWDENCVMDGAKNPIWCPGEQVLLFLNRATCYSGAYHTVGRRDGFLVQQDDRYVGWHFNVTVDEVKKSIESAGRRNYAPIIITGLAFITVIILAIAYQSYRKKSK